MSALINTIKSSTINKTSDPIWMDDFTILFKTDKLNEFFPTKKQTNEERLNSIVRLSIYVSIILCIYHSNTMYSSIFIFFLFFTFTIYKHHPKKISETNKINLTTVQQAQLEVEQAAQKEVGNPSLNNFTPTIKKSLGTLQNGDSGQEIGIEKLENEVFVEKSETCTKPTIANPFMNFTMADMMTFDENGNMVDRPPACDTNDPEIKQQIEEAFDNNLFKDVNDVFGKMNSQRNYFTMPWTKTINDQDAFARWLYLNPATCKENQENCLNFEDLRSKRFIMPNAERNPVSAGARATIASDQEHVVSPPLKKDI